MLFWLLAALVTGGVIFAITWPLRPQRDTIADNATAVAAGDSPSTHAADVAVYKDQLREIDTDAARGLLGPEEAEAAHIEVSRRLLAAAAVDGAATDTSNVSQPERITAWAFGACALLVPLAAIGLYLQIGTPGTPDLPREARLKIPLDKLPANELIARIEARLKAEPNDGRGWQLIAPIYLRQSRFNDAAQAYANAIRILGRTPQRMFGFASATVGANQGRVSDEALAVFKSLGDAQPAALQPQFWYAVGLLQRGQSFDARNRLAKLLEAPTASEDLKRATRLQIARIDNAGGGRGPAPDQDAAADIRALPEGEQAAQITAMVERLAARLNSEGGSAADWQRLIRSYAVLGKTTEAKAALAKARNVLKADANAMAALDKLAAAVGLKPIPVDG